MATKRADARAAADAAAARRGARASCWSSAAGSTRPASAARSGCARRATTACTCCCPSSAWCSEREVAEALAQLLDLPLAERGRLSGSAAARRSGQRQFPQGGAHPAARRDRGRPDGRDGRSARPLHDRRDAAVRGQAGAALGRRAGRHRGGARAPVRAQRHDRRDHPAGRRSGRTRRRGRRPAAARPGERGAGDPARQPADLARGRAARLGHPHRAVRAGPARALPRSTACCARSKRRRCSCAPRSSRASRSWRGSTSPSAACRRTAASSSRVRGKEIDLRVATMPTMHGEAVVMRILDRGSVALDFDDARLRRRCARRLSRGAHPAARHHPGHRPDRLRQDHHALHRADRAQHAGPQDPHRRGPDRVPARRHQPDPGQAADRPHASPTSCARSCARTRTSSWSARSATWRPRRSRSRRR